MELWISSGIKKRAACANCTAAFLIATKDQGKKKSGSPENSDLPLVWLGYIPRIPT